MIPIIHAATRADAADSQRPCVGYRREAQITVGDVQRLAWRSCVDSDFGAGTSAFGSGAKR